jgi:hypothetical protein
MKKKHVVISVIIIIIISLCFRLLVTDFSIPVNSDNLEYTLNSIAHTKGDFSQSSHRGMGWSLFNSVFFSFIQSDQLIDYSVTIKTLSIIIGLSTIPIVYLVSRKFFDEKYSIFASCLFAFEPHLNYNSTLGLAEPLMILSILTAFYFILNQNSRYFIIAAIFAGIAYWVRINGIWVLIALSAAFFITQKKSKKLFLYYVSGLALFLLIISPILVERNDEFGDPFYSVYKDTIWAGSYQSMISAIEHKEKISVFDYIGNNGVESFFYVYVLTGIYNTLSTIWGLSFPYLFILIPFGILFSFRSFDQNKNSIKSNWIFILVSIFLMCFTMAIVPDRRFVLYLLPFLMIFSVIPVQRVVEYGLSTFSFSRKQKDIFLIIIICIIIILSSLVIARYVPDSQLENEKLEFSKFALENLKGVTLRDYVGSLDYVNYILISESFQDFKINSSILSKSETYSETDSPDGKTIEEFILNAKNYDLKYVISNEKPGVLHPITDKLYDNYEKYPFLKKIFDSNEHGFQKLKIKVFEIDYKKFHEFVK